MALATLSDLLPVTTETFLHECSPKFQGNVPKHILDQFLFCQGLDQVGCDIGREQGSLADILTKALENPLCVAVNSLGYTKHSLFLVEKITWFDPLDGIYIKRASLGKLRLTEDFAPQASESRARFAQDLVVVTSLLPAKRNGLVVEVSGRDTIFVSNSQFLIDSFGWKGIVLDANAELFAQRVKRDTPCTYLYGTIDSRQGNIPLKMYNIVRGEQT
jgi:hypothetical protein